MSSSDSFIKNKNLETLSEQSVGEYYGPGEFEKIEFEIRKTKEKKQVKIEQEQKQQIDIQQLTPFFNNVTAINNHNLVMATQYMMQTRQLQEQIQKEKELAYKSAQKSEQYERKYDIMVTKLTKQIQDLIAEKDDIKDKYQKLHSEAILFNEIVKEKDHIINEKKELIKHFETTFAMTNEETSKLKAHIKQAEDKILELQDIIATQKLNIGQQKIQIDQLFQKTIEDKEQIEHLTRTIEQFNAQLKYETHLKEKYIGEIKPLEQQVQHKSEIIVDLKKQLESIKFDHDKAKAYVIQLEVGLETKYKAELTETTDKYMTRVVQQEKKLHENELDIARFRHEIEEQQIQIKSLDGEKQFYLREKEDMEHQIKLIEKERDNYLGEFRELKVKYEHCIHELEKSLKEVQIQFYKAQEEAKGHQNMIKLYEQRVNDLLDLQEIISMGNDHYFYRVITDMKQKGIIQINPEEMNRIKQEALQEQMAKNTKKTYEQATRQHKSGVDTLLRQTFDDKKEQFQTESELNTEWDQIFNKLNNFEFKSQLKLQ